MIKPEILAPVGNMEKGRVALAYGADAIYLGGKSFGLRAGAGNFSSLEMDKIISLAHDKGARVYVTVNIYAHNRDLKKLPSYLEELAQLDVDAIIIADPGVFRLAQKYAAQLPIHISTQGNVTNVASALFWQDLGASRINLARELTFEEIHEIRENVSLELEVFVHGAMCLAYSGRCLLSAAMTNRSANLGDCAQSCRWSYTVMEQQRPGEFHTVQGDERGSYIFNSRDICMINHIPELVSANAHGWKIEGRMKSVHYVATVTKAYRLARDRYFQDPQNYVIDPNWAAELEKISHRPYGTGFYLAKQGPGQSLDRGGSIRGSDFIGLVEAVDNQGVQVLVRNRFFSGETLEIISPQGAPHSQQVEIFHTDGQRIQQANPNTIVYIPLEEQVEPLALLRRVSK